MTDAEKAARKLCDAPFHNTWPDELCSYCTIVARSHVTFAESRATEVRADILDRLDTYAAGMEGAADADPRSIKRLRAHLKDLR